MIKVKICGITNLEDAQAAIDAGADALGFVFYKKSPRYINPKIAQTIIQKLPNHITKIGVFVNAKEKEIKKIARLCKLDMLQFHGSESPQFCGKFNNYKIIKVFRIKDSINFKNIVKYNTFAYLFDTYVLSKIGGTGKKFNWGLIRNISSLGKPLFLSGGLTEKNVQTAIKIARPAWLDVSSSVENKPGVKNKEKIKSFIAAVKNKQR
jgi:phosphoribosylanthranilate isomerase